MLISARTPNFFQTAIFHDQETTLRRLSFGFGIWNRSGTILDMTYISLPGHTIWLVVTCWGVAVGADLPKEKVAARHALRGTQVQ